MRLSFQACFIAISIVLSVNGDQSTPSCAKPYDKKMACNLICNFMMDSDANDAMKMLQAKLEDLIAMFNKSSSPQPTTAPQPPATTAVPASSCKQQYERDNSTKSQVFTLIFGSEKIPVYCHMGNFGCGDGGWTLAMKMDGTKKTFHYDSNFWSNKTGYNLLGGKTGFDLHETKLPTYWNTPFSKICLGMKIGHQMKFAVINKQANSLYSLIADGQFHSTSLGRSTWKSLIGSQASLQTGCNKEGFNVVGGGGSFARARIGILGNDQKDCLTCDSRIGFGTGGLNDDSSTCGNDSPKGYTSDNGAQNIKAMGYILVQ
ncbi:putative skeletal organic matrix protein 5 [Oculina patagonica]